MDRIPEGFDSLPSDAQPDELDDGIELLEDRTRRIQVTGHTRRLGRSLPAAIAASLVVAALAFGAAGMPGRPASSGVEDRQLANIDSSETDPDESIDYDQPKASTEPDASVEPKESTEPGESETPAESIKPEPTAEPKPSDEPDATVKPAPEIERLEIGLANGDLGVVVEWSACDPDRFLAYKIVRSSDEKVTYPKGENDVLVGVVERTDVTRFVDKSASAGKKLFYRVFGVVKTDTGSRLACASAAKGIVTPEPKPEPTPDPEVGTLGLTVELDGGYPWLDWTACQVDGFDAYKVVRSKNAGVSFPTGEGDSLIAAIGPDGKTQLYDKEAPGGRTVWYRVFCVDKTESGYVVRAASAARAVEVPVREPKPTPEPSAMGFEVDVTGEGVVLHWEAGGGESFAFYKVVRSKNPNPSYLPGTDGSEVIAVIENASVTEWVDTVDAGTWYYRVQSIGWIDGHKVLLGQTPVKSVTIE